MNVIVTVGAYYGPYVEYGTRRNRAYPFLWPAVEEERPRFISEMTAMLNNLR